jgi:hypothetical protein
LLVTLEVTLRLLILKEPLNVPPVPKVLLLRPLDKRVVRDVLRARLPLALVLLLVMNAVLVPMLVTLEPLNVPTVRQELTTLPLVSLNVPIVRWASMLRMPEV